MGGKMGRIPRIVDVKVECFMEIVAQPELRGPGAHIGSGGVGRLHTYRDSHAALPSPAGISSPDLPSWHILAPAPGNDAGTRTSRRASRRRACGRFVAEQSEQVGRNVLVLQQILGDRGHFVVDDFPHFFDRLEGGLLHLALLRTPSPGPAERPCGWPLDHLR